MIFFLIPWVVTLIGWIVHVMVDRAADKRTGHRVIELLLLWLLVFGGAWSIFAALFHLTGASAQTATGIGYAPSMFQWEVGWGDMALGVLGVGCAWRKMRDGWMTAAVVVLAIAFLGDAIGHIMQLVAHANHAPDNVWAIPSDIAGPVLAIVLLIIYRAGEKKLSDGMPKTA